MDGKIDCNNTKPKESCNNTTNHNNNGHDIGGEEDTSQSGGESSRLEPRTKGAAAAAAAARRSKRRVSSPTPEPRSSKRTRQQYQPFQSPTLLIPQLRPTKASEEKQVVFYKGEFLALRNESGSFYVCQAAQNVYKSSHRFKIRWLSKAEGAGPDMYSRDFYDYTDYECVLTNLEVERLDKNLFSLPKAEVSRTETILKRALNLENGIHDVEQEKIKPELVNSDDDVNNAIVKPEVKVERLTISTRRTVSDNTRASGGGGGASESGGRRLRITVTRNQPATRAAKAKLQNVIRNSRLKANKGNKVKVKQKTPKEVNNRGGCKSERLILQQRRKQKNDKDRLKPNTKVGVYHKDPTFESNINIPFVSTIADSKLMIRAILMKDTKTLQNMLNDAKNSYCVGVHRSVDQKLDPLAYATLKENHEAIKLILNCKKRSKKSVIKMATDTLLLHHSVGRTNFRSLGSAVREITLSRGSREGNNALMKDCYEELTDLDHVILMLRNGVSKSTLDCFLSEADTNQQSLKQALLSNLYRAACCGHRRLVADLLEEALKTDSYGFTALHRDVLVYDRQELRSCRPAIVKKRSVGNCGITPVHCAAINPAAKYLKQLLDTDPDCNIGDSHMRKPIHYAAACEGPAPLELLLSRGFKLDDLDADGNTVLHIASENGRVANVEIILKRLKADKRNGDDGKNFRDYGLGGINRPNRSSLTAVHLACIGGHLDVLKSLLKFGADIEKQTGVSKNKVTPLMLACQNGYIEMVKFLIQSGAKLEGRDKLRRTAATHAILNGHTHIASHLLRLGSDPDTTDSSGNSLLHYAVAYGWYFCVQLLLEAGANVNHVNDWKVTPLGVAFLKGHVGLVETLLNQPDVDIEYRDDNNMSIVMLAVCSPLNLHLVDVIRFLIVEKKAKCNSVDLHGNTALHWLASNSSRVDGKEGLLQHSETVQTSLKIAKLLLENNCDASIRNHRGQTVLTLAIQQGNNELVKLLLNDGCQVTAEVDDTGENLLHALVDHSWETDLSSLVQVIKDGVGKKVKAPSIGEESIELSLQNPAIPLLERLDSMLKYGDVINIKGLRNKSPEKLSFSLIRGKDIEKDDIFFDLSLQNISSNQVLVCRRRVGGEWTDTKETPLASISCASQGNDGKVKFEFSISVQEDVIFVMSSGVVVAEVNSDSLLKQELSLYVDGDVVINSIQVQRSSVTKPVLHSASLPSDVLREMAQTYSYDGFTPLLLACSKYHFTTDKKQQARLREMIKTLVEEADSEVHAVVKKRSDNKSRNIDGFSALHFLANAREVSSSDGSSNSSVPGLQLLLNYKSPINIQDHRGRTPLITAILSRQPAAAEALINSGADINLCSGDMDEDGCASPLILASKLGLVSVIKLLLKHGANVQLADTKDHSTALHYAVMMKTSNDALEIVHCLIEAGININCVNHDGRTPLHLAVNANSGCSDDIIEIEDLMIEKGADLMSRDSLGRIPLHYAFVKIGRPIDSSKIDPIEVVSLLTGAMKGNLDISDHYGQTPLHCAAFRGATISCMHLSQQMANINAKDKYGNTALSLAVLGSHDSCAIMLLQKGASIQVEVVVPPLEPRAQHREVVSAWQWKHVAEAPPSLKNSPLLQEVVKKDWQGVMYMILGQLQTLGSNFFPAVEAALRTGKFKLALNLIARSKNHGKLTSCNKNEQNLLHILACVAKSSDQPELQVKVAQVLVNLGVSLNVPDVYGSFPITYAAINRNSILCEFFTDQLGIEVVTKLPADKLGRTPLTAAFWSLGRQQWRDSSLNELRSWCLKLCSRGTSLDILVAYPYSDGYPGETWAVVNNNNNNHVDPSASESSSCRISPLVFAVCLHDYDLVAFLLQHGADINFADEHGRTPLMLAVRKNDVAMARLLLNPSYCYKLDIRRLQQKRKFNKLHCNKDQTLPLNRRPQIYDQNSGTSDNPRFSPHVVLPVTKQDDTTCNQNNVSAVTNCNEVKPKLTNNVNETDDDDVDEIEVDKPLVDVKQESSMKTRAINFMQTDRHGWTVIHHLIRPFSFGSYDSVEMLSLLADSGAPLDVSNTAGFSPLQMAIQGRAHRLAAELRKRIVKTKGEVAPGPIVEFTVKDGVRWNKETWDYKVDAVAVLERVESEAMEEGDEDTIVLPDVHSGMEEMGEVFMDTEQNILYDVFMTRVDVSCGVASCYNFFKMQVISQQGRSLYVLFTRWGKLGTEGEYQQTPHCSSDEAIREFCRVFKAKSGNNWQDVKKFQPVARKYRLVEAVQRGRKKLRDIPLNLATNIPSKMPPQLRTLMQNLCHIPMLQEACQDVGIDTSVMPFGRLCEAALRHGRHILRELKNVVSEKIKLEGDSKMRDRTGELAEKIVDLSSEYYQAVPQPGYVFEKVRPLDKLSDIQNCLNNLDFMFDLELVSKILLGAQLRVKEVNSLDYVYRSLDCQISAMQEDEIEAQYILQYIYNTTVNHMPAVERIYSVSRKQHERRLLSDEPDTNPWLLWHGVHVAKLISVLVRGLGGAALELDGDKEDFVHKELRFADTFEMAHETCHNYSKQIGGVRYILLCEVPLNDPDGETSTMNSTSKQSGTYFPDPVCNLVLTSGVTIPLGSLTCLNDAAGNAVRGLADYNEYLVSKAGNVCIRYIVQYRCDDSERQHKANKVPTHS